MIAEFLAGDLGKYLDRFRVNFNPPEVEVNVSDEVPPFAVFPRVGDQRSFALRAGFRTDIDCVAALPKVPEDLLPTVE